MFSHLFKSNHRCSMVFLFLVLLLINTGCSLGIADKSNFVKYARYKEKVVLNLPFSDAYDCVRAAPDHGSPFRSDVLSDNKRADIYLASGGLYYALIEVEALLDYKTEVRIYTHSPLMTTAHGFADKVRYACKNVER